MPTNELLCPWFYTRVGEEMDVLKSILECLHAHAFEGVLSEFHGSLFSEQDKQNPKLKVFPLKTFPEKIWAKLWSLNLFMF